MKENKVRRAGNLPLPEKVEPQDKKRDQKATEKKEEQQEEDEYDEDGKVVLNEIFLTIPSLSLTQPKSKMTQSSKPSRSKLKKS